MIADGIEIAVVGHDRNIFPVLESPVLKSAILHELNYDKPHYATNSLGESRFFLANNFFKNDSEIIGCLTASWDRKYIPLKLNSILEWPTFIKNYDNIKNSTNTILCSTLCYGMHAKPKAPMWEIDFQKHFRQSWPQTEWIGEIIYRITGFKYDRNNIAPYANQIICNHILFKELCYYIRSIIDDVILNFGLYPNFHGIAIDRNRTLAYILEEITMLWWSQYSNIRYISCGHIIPGWYK